MRSYLNDKMREKSFSRFHVLLSFLTPSQHSVALIINFKVRGEN